MCYYSCPNVHYLVTLCIYYLSVLYVHLNLLHCIFCFCTLPLLYFINMLILPNKIKSNTKYTYIPILSYKKNSTPLKTKQNKTKKLLDHNKGVNNTEYLLPFLEASDLRRG